MFQYKPNFLIDFVNDKLTFMFDLLITVERLKFIQRGLLNFNFGNKTSNLRILKKFSIRETTKPLEICG